MKESPYLKHKDEFVKLYNEGYSLREIAKMYNIPCNSVISNLIKSEVNIRPKSNLNNEETLKKAISLYEEGMSINKISKSLNVGYATLKNRLAKYFDIEVTYKYEHLIQDIKLDYKNGLSARDISEKYNISVQTVCNYLHLEKNKVRSYEEALRVYSLDEDYFNINLLTKERVSDLAKIERNIRFYTNNRVKIVGPLDRFDDFYSKVIYKFSSSDKEFEIKDGKYFLYEIVSKSFSKNIKETLENIQNTDFFDYFIEECLKYNTSVTGKYIGISTRNVNRDLFRKYFESIGFDVFKTVNEHSLCVWNLEGIDKLVQKYPFILDKIKENPEKKISKRFFNYINNGRCH